MAIAQFSGLASGIDSASLIDATIEARELTNQLRRQNIEFLESENESLDELNSKLLALDELVDRFRTVNSGGIAKKGTSSDPSILTATAGTNAVNATYDLTVSQIADTATGSFDDSYSSADAVLSNGGTVTVDVGVGAASVQIQATITGGVTTLEEVANQINSDPDADGRVVASVVNIGSGVTPDYRLMFNTLETGEREGRLLLSSTSADFTTTNIQQARDAEFTIDGITGTITRTSNTVGDVISGVTFQLTDTGSASVSIGNDVDKTADEMSEIVDAFNDIVEFINENDTVDRIEDDENVANVFGSLAKTRVDNDFLSAFRLALLSADSGSGDEVQSMSELGLSTNRDGTLTFDSDEFKEQAGADADGATGVLQSFADQVAGASGMIFQYTRLNGFIDNAQSGNNTEIESLNDSIQQLERRTAKLRDSLTKQFARLETITSGLQSQQQALSGILAGL